MAIANLMGNMTVIGCCLVTVMGMQNYLVTMMENGLMMVKATLKD